MASPSQNYIEDEYEHLDNSLEYVLENVLSEEVLYANDVESKILCEDYNSILVNYCECSGDPCGSSNCVHGGNYTLNTVTNPPELVLSSTIKRDIFCECCKGCKCRYEKCLNRLVQKGPRKGLKIIESEIFKSRGLATTVVIPQGAFICEYAGELLTASQAQHRILKNQKENKMNYIICLNEIDQTRRSSICRKTFVDPSARGNIARYMNHSCNPNCEVFSIRVDCPIPKLCLFSKRLIKAGEELCFHYGGGENNITIGNELNQRILCLCQSENCLNFLPNTDF